MSGGRGGGGGGVVVSRGHLRLSESLTRGTRVDAVPVQGFLAQPDANGNVIRYRSVCFVLY